MNVEAAQRYHGRHGPQALFVRQHGETLLEAYDGEFDRETPHALYSGTKSFWGITALEAQREGLFDLDERVWNGATLRQLLTLTAGVPFGGLGPAVPPYAKALETLPNAAPGERFTYGGIPLQIFGAVFARRLEPLALTPHEYLRERVLAPADVTVAKWRELKDGTHPLPTGAFLTAREWAKYGAYVLGNRRRFAQAFTGTDANPRYGLGWWLAPPKAPADLFYASGSGGQAMYVVPSEETVIVRFGNGGSFNHEAFLRACFS
jgi:CubicO group peptidase (beta-lactamase class C family)